VRVRTRRITASRLSDPLPDRAWEIFVSKKLLRAAGQDSAREARGQASAVSLERTVSHALFEALIILSAFIRSQRAGHAAHRLLHGLGSL
jgi:hypothetical protein